MILQDQVKIWITSRKSYVVDGEAKAYYVNLRSELVNMQYMSNTMETKAYGQITSSAVEIRTDDTIDLCKGDCIYMTKPEIEGMTEMDEVSVTHYPSGDYEVKSIKPSYIGGNHIRNPTLITADLVTKND